MKTVIFDLDGTVLDSMPMWNNLALDMLKQYDIDFPGNILEILTPMGLTQGAEYVISLGLPLTKEEILRAEIEYAAEHYALDIPAKPGVLELMKKLKGTGVKMYSFTAGSPELFIPCAERLGITDFVEKFYTADMFGMAKSQPDAWLKLAQEIAANPKDITVFDDNLENVTAAKQAGMRVIGVYDDSAKHNTDKIKAVCDGFIYDFTELL